MSLRAMCTDIDGTLLNKEKQLSARTIAIIKRIKSLVPIVLASSRMPSAMTHLQRELDILDHPLICYNGAYTLRYKDGAAEILYNTVIAAPVSRSIYNLAQQHELHASLYVEDNWYAPAMDRWTEREERITKVKATIADPGQVMSQWNDSDGAHKIMCMGDAENISRMFEQLHKHHGQDIHIYLSRPTYLELAPRNISKGSALKLVAERWLNISISEVVAFGDNYNDIDMLKMAGLGVAVRNARDEVKEVANKIIHESIDDGVAKELEFLFQGIGE